MCTLHLFMSRVSCSVLDEYYQIIFLLQVVDIISTIIYNNIDQEYCKKLMELLIKKYLIYYIKQTIQETVVIGFY